MLHAETFFYRALSEFAGSAWRAKEETKKLYAMKILAIVELCNHHGNSSVDVILIGFYGNLTFPLIQFLFIANFTTHIFTSTTHLGYIISRRSDYKKSLL